MNASLCCLMRGRRVRNPGRSRVMNVAHTRSASYARTCSSTSSTRSPSSIPCAALAMLARPALEQREQVENEEAVGPRARENGILGVDVLGRRGRLLRIGEHDDAHVPGALQGGEPFHQPAGDLASLVMDLQLAGS